MRYRPTPLVMRSLPNVAFMLSVCALCLASLTCGGKSTGLSGSGSSSGTGMSGTVGSSGSSGTAAATSGASSGTVASGGNGNAGPSDAAPAQGDGIAPSSPCDPRACSSGCCATMGCLPGTAADACGFGGQACTDCTAIGLDCIVSLSDGGGACGSSDAGSIPDGAPACGPETCVGCCAGGVCVAGTASASCGSHGLACQPCTGANVICVAQAGGGACVGSGLPCGPSNCAGCCDANGVCQDPRAIDACGAAGTACQFCLAGQACNSGQCVTASGCGPSNCPGCCQGATCLSGSVDSTACGSGGGACQACPARTPCFPLGPKNGGQCPPAGSSSSGNCGVGCSDLSPGGTCHPGDTNDYCRGPNSGQGCGTCGGSCATGICMGGDFCTGATCPNGCCTPDGTCWTSGVDDAHCGGGAGAPGQLCIDCGPGFVCDSSSNTSRPTCLIACSPQNCQGCCLGAVCVTGTDPSSCGTSGNVCAQCAQAQSCVNGACIELAQCGPIECAGCCQNNVCLVGRDNATCGTGGAACQDCGDAGQICLDAGCGQ
jgi:hypothetical protein